MRKLKMTIMSITLLVLFCGCDLNKSQKEELKKTVNSDVEVKDSITWFVNMFEAGQEKPIDEIECSCNEVNVNVSILYQISTMKHENVELLCMLIADNTLVPFKIQNKEMDNVQLINVKNGIKKCIEVSFSTVAMDYSNKDIIFLAIPNYYAYSTENMLDNTILCCKKKLKWLKKEEKSSCENDISEYVTTNNTVDLYEKELHELSPFNGSLKDFIIQREDGSVYYMGDYKKSKGITFLFLDGYPIYDEEHVYYIRWNNDKRFINARIDGRILKKGEHIMFAITLRENETVLARKSFNTKIIIH